MVDIKGIESGDMRKIWEDKGVGYAKGYTKFKISDSVKMWKLIEYCVVYVLHADLENFDAPNFD